MGVYLNPRGEEKEQFLQREGIALSKPLAWEDVPKDCRLVCLVHNPEFSAAAIAYRPSEIEAFTLLDDMRPKQWFLVPTAKLLEACKGDKYAKNLIGAKAS